MTASRIVATAFVGLCTIAAFGQIPPPPPGATNPNNPTQAQPVPGTTNGPRDTRQQPAGQNDTAQKPNDTGTQNPDANVQPLAPKEGPDIVDDPNATPEEKASAEYSGPAVLSRGISASSPMNPKNIKFTPSVGLEFTEQSGLTGVAVQSNGKLSDSLSSGVMLNYGINGEKVYRRDTISLLFAGTLTHYFQFSTYDGTSNQLAFTWQHKMSKRLSFGIRETLQEFNNNNLLISGAPLINSGLGTTLVTATPTTEAFDGRVITMLTEGSLTWQLNARLSINLSGGGFFTRRASTSLYGDSGYQAGTDLAYRITRRTTVGTYYAYTHFDYIGIYGGSDINTVGLAYSIAFNPRTQLITRVGGSRLETTGLTGVTLSPVLALLLGTHETVEAIYLRNYEPDFNLQLRRKISNLELSVAYQRGITPGNGVILTSVQNNLTFGANYAAGRGGRKWNVTPTFGFGSLSGFGTTNQKYATAFAGLSVYRSITRTLSWNARINYNHYTFDNTGFLRNNYGLTTGVVWSPGDAMERLW